MTLDRTTPPAIRQLSEFSISLPERRVMKNGMPLNIINAGTEDVVRFDLLIGGGQWHQEQPLQAMFTNRMLREGAGRLRRRLPRNWIIMGLGWNFLHR